ncbi:MAG: UDP-galactopyranose mutase [Lachnospiraceae bacterium]|nr:UDP-galactopyranose mutase [Lachnospiraceae bacterium]
MSRPILIVGAGMFGSVMAERIASQLKRPVTVIDKRPHIGGNCWSEIDPETGIEFHKYGPHIFHTSNKEVWDYISQFTEWNNYQHHGWTRYQGKVYSLPINLQTINAFYGKNLSPEQARNFIAAEAAKEQIKEPQNLEEKAVSLIGRPLYEAFIRGYTIKQWEKDPRELAPEIITRLPVRFNYNGRYFNDRWEGIPLDGYGKMFERMLDDPLITVRLNTDWFDIRETVPSEALVIYTGPIDRFFDYRLGNLEWRTVKFEKIRYDIPDFQGAAIVNCSDADISYTRTSEYRHFHPERSILGKTVVFNEYSYFSSNDDDPYYPISTERNRSMYNSYKKIFIKNVIFGGRLGTYQYLDMDKAVHNALHDFEALQWG